jgi:hypothetical protein
MLLRNEALKECCDRALKSATRNGRPRCPHGETREKESPNCYS